MKLDLKSDQRYMADGYGEPIWLHKPSSTYYGMTYKLGYASYNMDWINASVTKEVLKEHFEAVEDIQNISYIESKKTLHFYDEMYKHKETDSYIFVALNLSKQAEWNDADPDGVYKEDHFKVHKLFYKKDDNLQKITDFYSKVLRFKSDNKTTINLVIKTPAGFEFKEFDIKPLSVNIDRHYNDNFKEVHSKLVEDLKESKKGIVMLHGDPGTGKTNYIKYLTGLVPDKKFVFIPSNMIGYLSEPGFIGNLIENQNSILVLEDCEQYLKDRKLNTGNNGFVSTLLNISDGILSDILSIQIICTFNNDLKQLDPALLRDGRLLVEYKFGPLENDKAKRLAKEIDVDLEQASNKTLSGIFNADRKINRVEKTQKIGF